MKLQVRFLRTCSAVLLLVIVGCGPSQTPTILITPSVSPERPIAATSTPIAIISGQTPTALVVPSATIATIAVMPTLDMDHSNNFLQKVLEGNSTCMLPCWAGLMPGVASNTQAETMLQPLSVLIYGGPFYPFKGKQLSGAGGSRIFLFNDTKIRFRFGWYSELDKDTVEMLRINADALKNEEWTHGDESYNQLFESYNLHNILSQYGVPSQVWTIAEVYYDGNEEPNPSLSEEFDLLLFYDKGIFIKYTMPLHRIGDDNGRACPSEAFFDLGLVAPETADFYQEMWFSVVTGSQDFTNYKLIESSTQMTFDEFYQVFTESNNTCFEIPLTIWPKR
jgi:hypothetical protein